VAEPIAAGDTPLDELQRWMLRVVTHPDGLTTGLAAARDEGLWPAGADTLADIVPGNERLSPEDQLQIYAYAYQERLREVLASENPTVEHLLGADRFADLARAFLGAHPPHSFTLDHLGHHLAPWLDAHDDPVLQAAADMVRVEQAMDKAFDASPQPPADPGALAALPMEAWATARLSFREGLVLLALQHDVMGAMTAAKRELPAEVPPRRPAWVAAYARDFRRFRMALEEHEHRLLARLVAGDTLGDGLQRVALQPTVDVQAMMGSVSGWFRRWMDAGWIVDLTIEETG